MDIIICCDMLKDFREHKNIDVSYTNEMVFVGSPFSNYRMKYCPFCGKEIKWKEVVNE